MIIFRLLKQRFPILAGTSPFVTMHEDVCNLAFDKHAVLIILPFHKHTDDSGYEQCNPNIQSMNVKVLRYSPCSVAILVDHGLNYAPVCSIVKGDADIFFRVSVLFLGGADDREALTYAKLMADNPAVGLTVVRILLSEEIDETENEEVINEFKNIVDDERIVYREEVVSDGTDTVEILRKLCEECVLMIVGRREGKKSAMTAGLETWSEYPELGVIGDLMATAEFGAKVSTLVVQQQHVKAKGGWREGAGGWRWARTARVDVEERIVGGDCDSSNKGGMERKLMDVGEKSTE